MKPKFIFFGTPGVASETLMRLIENGYVPELVVTAPDRPKGRGLILTPPETAVVAREHGIPLLQPERLTEEVRAEILKHGASYAIVVAYGKILPEALISAFPLGVLNIHYSLLPKYRGASPVESALKNGETVTGVAIQRMVYDLDAGDVLSLREVSIGATETARELRPRLIEEGARLLLETLPGFILGTIAGTPQNHAEATHCGKIKKEDGLLDLSGDATTNWNTYRAYAESPGTYFFMEKNGTRIRVKLKEAALHQGKFVPLRVVPEGKGETAFDELIKGGYTPVMPGEGSL